MNKLFKAAMLVAGIMAFGVLIGWMWGRGNAAQKTVTDQTILTALRERGFLVTETLVSDVTTNIKTDETSIWKKLFWGQEIKASAVSEVNLGVDLAKLSETDIQISGNQVNVSIPSVEIFDSRLIGDISVENKQGILKRFLENDDGYNQAMAELLKQAEAAAMSSSTLEGANDRVKIEIKRLVGYMIPNKEIIVNQE